MPAPVVPGHREGADRVDSVPPAARTRSMMAWLAVTSRLLRQCHWSIGIRIRLNAYTRVSSGSRQQAAGDRLAGESGEYDLAEGAQVRWR